MLRTTDQFPLRSANIYRRVHPIDFDDACACQQTFRTDGEDTAPECLMEVRTYGIGPPIIVHGSCQLNCFHGFNTLTLMIAHDTCATECVRVGVRVGARVCTCVCVCVSTCACLSVGKKGAR